MEKTIISKKQLIISLVFNGGNTLIFIYYFIKLVYNLHLLQYLTFLSYIANSIFLLLCLICDIILFIKNNPEGGDTYYQLIDDQNINNNDIPWVEKLNNFNRNQYGVICNTYSFFVSISFWILYFLGEDYIEVSNTLLGALSTLNLHLFISIFVIIDILVSKREHAFSEDFFTYIALIFVAYCVMTGIDKYFFNINPYAFMEESVLFLIFYVLISFVVLYVSYLFNVYLINLKKEEHDILLIKDI